MPNTTIKTKIQMRRDTTANWLTNKDVVPAAGEPCFDLDTGILKIGDGVTTYENLKPISGSGASHYEGVKGEGETDMDVISRVLTTASITAEKDDIFIVKTLISGDKYTYTAYVYDVVDEVGTWKAMDGNYSAENVYFSEDLIYTANIGVKTVPSSGSGTISAAGKNVKEVFASILASEKNPTKTNPSCSVTLTGGNKSLEVGSKVTPAYTTSFNAGSYQYGPATGITASSYTVSFNGEEKDTASGSFSEYTVAEGTKKISLSVDYTEGAIPKTNLGNSYEAGKIPAGTCTATSTHGITGYRNMFYGPMATADAALNSANIRALSGKKASATGNLPTFGAGAGAAKIVVAVPTGRRISKVIMPSALNADVTSLFVKQSGTVSVEGAGGYAGANYDVYVYQPASIDSAETYTVTIA